MERISLVDAKHETYLQLWRDRVMECRNSGKSAAVWCEENGINIKTVIYGLRRTHSRSSRNSITAF